MLMGHPPMHQEEILLRRWLLEAIPILRTKDIPTTMLCTKCKGTFSARQGTAYFGVHAEEPNYTMAMRALAEGVVFQMWI